MLMNLLLLAMIINFEPTRIGLLPLLLTREKPLRQLMFFLMSSLSVNLCSGLLILFVFEHHPFAVSSLDKERVQLGVGSIALAISIIIALRWLSRRHSNATSDFPEEVSAHIRQLRYEVKPDNLIRRTLHKYQSPWFAGLLGVAVGLPSIDYLAILVFIATSEISPLQQTLSLMMFVLTGSLVFFIPLLGFLLAPSKTMNVLERFGAWARLSNRIVYAALLAILGFFLIWSGST